MSQQTAQNNAPDLSPAGKLVQPIADTKGTPAAKSKSEVVGSMPPANLVRGPLPWRLRDQVLIASTCTVALAFMVLYCARSSHWGADPIELEQQPQHELDYEIDLNEATWVEWSQLPGIGPVLANRIVEERERNGPFRNVQDLDRVKGIGPKKIEAIRRYIRTAARENANQTAGGPLKQTDPMQSP